MTIYNDDALIKLKEIKSNSVDSLVTDPPYGIAFMGKDWDKALPNIKIWEQCFRVMKSGSFGFIMTISRADIMSKLILQLEKVGFVTKFSPIYWTYASGFPKAMNMSKAIDKRLGLEQDIIGYRNPHLDGGIRKQTSPAQFNFENPRLGKKDLKDGMIEITSPKSKQAKELDGSYAGYSPKPAVEIIIVVMKPLSEKSYIEQAMKNQKGITWLDNVRIPTKEIIKHIGGGKKVSHFPGDHKHGKWEKDTSIRIDYQTHNKGRFHANLLISDNILDTGKKTKSRKFKEKRETGVQGTGNSLTFYHEKGETRGVDDEGDFSRYFDMDAWFYQNINLKDLPQDAQQTFPFLIIPKPSQSEKNAGLDGEPKQPPVLGFRPTLKSNPENWKNLIQETPYGGANRAGKRINNHATVKPVKLMSYLITLGSRKGDVILDPFLGSGTTVIAAILTSRKYIGMEINKEYFDIAIQRLKFHEKKQKKVNQREHYARMI